MSEGLIVTIDGPGGTGKSTVARIVAARSGLPHLDTGAYYRAATLAVVEAGIDPEDAEKVVGVVTDLTMGQVGERMFLDGRDVTAEIRGEEVTASVSAVSAHPAVREHLVGLQREWMTAQRGAGVVEGRDIGSVVFPEADVKVFLDATPEVRARRRALQTGEDPKEVLADLNRRDRLDSTRSYSPLVVPDGAKVIDTSDLSIEEVVSEVLDLMSAKS